MSVSLLYITCGSLDEAREIGRTLVGERLAACANILDGMRSLYWWDGELREDSEVVLIAKTRDALVEAVTERVRALHSYTVPCVLELKVGRGNPAYLDWLVQETAPRASSD